MRVVCALGLDRVCLGRGRGWGDVWSSRALPWACLGATSMIHRAAGWNSAVGAWLRKILERRPARLATVALANKMARIAWAVMARKEVYRPKGAIIAVVNAAA